MSVRAEIGQMLHTHAAKLVVEITTYAFVLLYQIKVMTIMMSSANNRTTTMSRTENK